METIAAVSGERYHPKGEPIVRHQYSVEGGGHNGPLRLWKEIKEPSCLAKFEELGYSYERIMNGDGNVVTSGAVHAHVLFRKDGRDVVLYVRATPDHDLRHQMNLEAFLVK